MYEIEIYNGRNTADGSTIEYAILPVEATCITDLEAQAYGLQRQLRAEHVNFGLAIERFDDGSPAYPKEEKRRR